MQTVSGTPIAAAFANAAATIRRASFNSSRSVAFMPSRPACVPGRGFTRRPGYADIAVDEGLTGHAKAVREIGLGQVRALLRLYRVGVFQPGLDAALAGAAQTA